MGIMEIVSKVVGLLIVKNVQEIDIWAYDTDVLYLDGQKENFKMGCNPHEMNKLANSLKSILPDAGYNVYFTGFNVSWERVIIYLKEDSEIAKQYPMYTQVEEDNDEAWIGEVYFHR